MAMTGFFYTFTRPRTAHPMSMLKYDPIGTSSACLSRLRWKYRGLEDEGTGFTDQECPLQCERRCSSLNKSGRASNLGQNDSPPANTVPRYALQRARGRFPKDLVGRQPTGLHDQGYDLPFHLGEDTGPPTLYINCILADNYGNQSTKKCIEWRPRRQQLELQQYTPIFAIFIVLFPQLVVDFASCT